MAGRFCVWGKLASSLFWIFWLLCLSSTVRAEYAPDPDDGGLKLPPGFHAFVFADNLGKLEFMTVRPNGDIYIHKRNQGIVALRCSDGSGRADIMDIFGRNDHGGSDVVFRGDWLYYTTASEVYRYRLQGQDLFPSSEPERIVTGLPAEEEHVAKTLAFDPQGNLYVEVGSPSNASAVNDRSRGAKGIDPTPLFRTHAGFWKFKPDVKDQTQKDATRFGTGFPNIRAVAWQPVSQALFVVMSGREQLHDVDPADFTPKQNAELPAEEMHKLTATSNFGWPFTYYDPFQKARMIAPEFGGDGKKRDESGKYPAPLVAFPAHWSPRQMIIYTGTQFPKKYRDGAFIAFHGSWDRAPLPQTGYYVGFAPFNSQGMPTGRYEIFADGFAGKSVIFSPQDAKYRPNGLAMGPDGSLYVADSEHGRVWCIFYSAGMPGKVVQPINYSEKNSSSQAAIPEKPLSSGGKLYQANCANCHQITGTGLPGVIPSLVDSEIVEKKPDLLIRTVLFGLKKTQSAKQSDEIKTMHNFLRLKDKEVAMILTYVRQEFGKGAPAIDAQTVSQIRAEKIEPAQPEE